VGGRLGTADRSGRRNRERGCGGKEQRRQLSPTEQRERERERSERAGWRRQVGPACQTQGARGLGLLGWLGPKWPFPFSWNFYCLFYLFSLGFSIQIRIKFQIQAKSNICNNSKNI
jgi:hypothetical protein